MPLHTQREVYGMPSFDDQAIGGAIVSFPLSCLRDCTPSDLESHPELVNR